MKTLFVTAGGINWASSRMRAYWVAPYMDDAQVIPFKDFGADTPEHDVYIFQKLFDQQAAADLRAAGKRVYWDICDPLWWWHPNDVIGFLANCDGVVCSTDTLAIDLSAWMEEQGIKQQIISVIPDRLELSHFPIQHDYSKQSQVTRFIWYGMSSNRIGLYAAIDNLQRLKANGYDITLTIFDDRPDVTLELGNIPVYHIKWSVNNENQVIAEHDIALLPPYPGPWGKVKSNNRALTARACGIVATSGYEYGVLKSLIGGWDREMLSKHQGMDESEHHVKESAKQWQNILNHS